MPFKCVKEHEFIGEYSLHSSSLNMNLNDNCNWSLNFTPFKSKKDHEFIDSIFSVAYSWLSV